MAETTTICEETPPSPRDVDAELAVLAGYLNTVNARIVETVEYALDTGAWKGSEIWSAEQWLAWQLGTSAHHAGEYTRLARRRAEFPVAMGTFDAGELAIDQVTQVVKAPAWADERVTQFAKVATVTQLKKAMRDEWFSDDTDSAEPTAPAKDPKDRCNFGVTGNHRWRLNAELDLAAGRRVEAALTEAKDALFRERAGDNRSDEPDGGETRDQPGPDRPDPERADPSPATWAEAFVSLADRSLDGVESRARRDRYRVWFHYDVTDGTATTTDGWRIPDHIRDGFLCDAVIQPIWETEGRPFNIGRASRIVPDDLRRVVTRRDRGCRVPGCNADRFVEVHHIIHWTDLGPTVSWNLICLCPRHHKLHHQGKLGITGDADDELGVTFTDWMGRALGPNGQPTIPVGPPPSPKRTWQRPEGARMDWHWFNGWDRGLIQRQDRYRSITRRAG